MMDCKKALTATEGDMDKAVEFLREKGLATAQKKANRVAAEGLCKTLVADDAKNAVVVEVNSETDFVAKNEKFQQYVADVAAQALTTTAADIDAFLAEAWALDTTKTCLLYTSSDLEACFVSFLLLKIVTCFYEKEVIIINLTGMILKMRYCILEQVGAGGEGHLYLARDMELGNRCV